MKRFNLLVSYVDRNAFISKSNHHFINRIRVLGSIVLLLLSSSQYLYGQTSGPTASEFRAISPQTDLANLVDPFTGDFSYSIPLFELESPNGSFPFTLSYKSGVGLNQEATWVGLGWNLTPGFISRNMRGIPDDYSGEEKITYERDKKPKVSFGLGAGANLETASLDWGKLGGSYSYYITWDSYYGLGYKSTNSINFSVGWDGDKNQTTLTGGLSVSKDLFAGESISPSLSIGLGGKKSQWKLESATSINSLSGMSSINFSSSYNRKLEGRFDKDGNNRRWDYSTSSNWDLAKPSFIPSPRYKQSSHSFSGIIKFGTEAQLFFPNSQINFYISENSLHNQAKNQELKAYGYLHLDEVPTTEGDQDPIPFVVDSNKEYETMITPTTQDLTIGHPTYDIFSVSTPGISGSFRAYRNDFGILKNSPVVSNSLNVSASIELGAGGLYKVGGDASAAIVKNESGIWDNEGELTELHYKSGDTWSKPYFKFMDEISIDRGFFEKIGSDNQPPVTDYEIVKKDNLLPLKLLGPDQDLSTDIVGEDEDLDQINANLKRSLRNPRSKYIQYFTADDYALYKDQIPGLKINYIDGSNNLKEFSPNVKNEQIAAFIIHSADGKKYVFALAVMNNVNKMEIHSHVECESGPCNKLTEDITTYVKEGTEKFKEIKSIPEYAYGYYLTSILGDDYIDLDDIPGPSDGDLGYWVKFTYKQMISEYVWKAPYDGVNINEGNFNDGRTKDDKVTFSWGTKEIFHLQSAETAKQLAQFIISTRRDSKEANMSGFGNNDHNYKLDKVKLYKKNVLGSNDLLKEINFTYNYSLAKGTPDNNPSDNNSEDEGGKLTLKEVYFTYPNNKKGENNPYSFRYSLDVDETDNPDYESHHVDVWGNYRKHESIKDAKFRPWNQQTEEKRAIYDKEANYYQLRTVTLPSKGEININYESDRYGFVQDKRSLQMLQLHSPDDDEWVKVNHLDERNKIYFQLNSVTDYNGLKKCFNGVEQTYFKILVRLKLNTLPQMIEGFAEIEEYGLYPNNSATSNVAWVKLKNRGNRHPFNLAAWQHLRLNQPELISEFDFNLDEEGLSGMDAEDYVALTVRFAEAAAGPFGTFLSVIIGFNNEAFIKGWGQHVRVQDSYIRLAVPDSSKYGGGNRVRSITFSNSLNELTGESSRITGFVYDYRNSDGTCSGIATYEPTTGSEENPLRTMNKYKVKKIGASNIFLHTENPHNSYNMPAPSVGYSRIVIRTLNTNSRVINSSNSGERVMNYYTAKDYPIKFNKKRIDPEKRYVPVIIPYIGQYSWKNLSMSNAYSVTLNDMHGKIKSEERFEYVDGSPKATPHYSKKYEYSNDITFVLHLPDSVSKYYKTAPQLYPVKQNLYEFDISVNAEYGFVKTYNPKGSFNVEGFMAGIIPMALPIPMPAYTWNRDISKIVSTNKVVRKKHILSKVIETNQGIINTYVPLYHDPYTGEVRLSGILNQYNDTIYTWKKPAYVDYEGLGPVYNSLDLVSGATYTTSDDFENNNELDINIDEASVFSKIKKNDHFILYNPRVDENTPGHAISGFILSRNTENSVNARIVLGTLDQLDNANLNFRIVDSGNTNQLGLTSENIQSLKNPVLDYRWDRCQPDLPPTLSNVTFDENDYETRERISQSGINAITLINDLVNRGKGNPLNTSKNNKCKYQWNPFTKKIKYNDSWIWINNNRKKVNIKKIDRLRGINYGNNGQLLITYNIGGLEGRGVLSAESSQFLSTYDTLYGKFNMAEIEFDSVDVKILDDVLEARATTYMKIDTSSISDIDPGFFQYSAKYLETNNLQNFEQLILEKVESVNIYRVRENYVYNTIRNDLAAGVEKNGTFAEFSYFYSPSCENNWVVKNSNNYFNPFGYPLQIADAFKTKATYLYGYNNEVNTAQSINAEYKETAFDSFEEYKPKQEVKKKDLSSTNFDFEVGEITNSFQVNYSLNRSYMVASNLVIEEYPITPVYSSGSGNVICMEIPDYRIDERIAQLGEVLGPVPGTMSVNSQNRFSPGFEEGYHRLFRTDIEIPSNQTNPTGRFHTYPINTQRSLHCINVGEEKEYDVEVTSEKAHTGKHSLKVNKEVTLPQSRFQPHNGREYMISVWVWKDRLLQNFSNQNYLPKIYVDDLEIQWKSKIIEGWIKYEGTFNVDETGADHNSNIVFVEIKIEPGGGGLPVFIDDIRLHPVEASFKSYVFNPENNLLSAELDDNNYATFYYYDEEQRLYLEKKETINGIITLKEYKTHVATSE
ncbi:MAG: hypothetical protein ACFHWX_07885 [Bacteroidota bacterium]